MIIEENKKMCIKIFLILLIFFVLNCQGEENSGIGNEGQRDLIKDIKWLIFQPAKLMGIFKEEKVGEEEKKERERERDLVKDMKWFFRSIPETIELVKKITTVASKQFFEVMNKAGVSLYSSLFYFVIIGLVIYAAWSLTHALKARADSEVYQVKMEKEMFIPLNYETIRDALIEKYYSREEQKEERNLFKKFATQLLKIYSSQNEEEIGQVLTSYNFFDPNIDLLQLGNFKFKNAQELSRIQNHFLHSFRQLLTKAKFSFLTQADVQNSNFFFHHFLILSKKKVEHCKLIRLFKHHAHLFVILFHSFS